MTFVHPEALPWLWAATAIPLLYIVRRRARRERVPHLFLWDRVFERPGRTRVNRIREYLSILLQVLIVAALILAWAEPQISEDHRVPVRTLVVIDRSLSMSAARTDGQTRLERAVEEIRSELGDLVADGDVTIATAAEELHPLVPLTRDVETLKNALVHLPPPRGSLDVEVLATRLTEMRARDPLQRTIFISDGAFAGAERLEELLPKLEILAVGDERGNAGIVDVELAETDEGVAVNTTIVAGSSPQVGRLELRDGEEVIASTPFELMAKAEAEIPLSAKTERERFLTLELVMPDADALGDDDRAELWIPRSPRARVLVVGKGEDRYLKSGLGALSEHVDTAAAATISVADWRRAEGYDLIIMKGVDEGRSLPPGSYLLIDCKVPGLPLTFGERSREVEVVKQSKGDQLLRGVDLRDLSITEARRTKPSAGVTVVLAGNTGSLICRGELDGVRFVHLAFDISEKNSSLVLLPGFPLLLADALAWLVPERRRLFAPWLRAGAAFAPSRALPGSIRPFIEFDEHVEELRILGPGPTLRAPLRPGRGAIRAGSSREDVAVNLCSRRISNLEPRFRPGLARAAPPPALSEVGKVDVVPLFLALAFGFLLVEWLLFNLGWTH